MPAITLKNIPTDLYNRIKQSARMNFRSMNAEILFRLVQTIDTKPIDPDELLEKISTLNRKLNLPPLTDEFLNQAKNEGRE